MDDTCIKLRCLALVMESGSEVDRREPTDKAQQLYDWVKETTSKEAPEVPEESGQPYGVPPKGTFQQAEGVPSGASRGSGKAPKK